MYKAFTKKQFDYLLNGVLIENKLGFKTEIEYFDTWEYVYEISTKNKAVSILMFTSIDKRTDRTRVKGNDRVRLVIKWETEKGTRYRRLRRHNRVENLFKNIKNTLSNFDPFNLNGDFKTADEYGLKLKRAEDKPTAEKPKLTWLRVKAVKPIQGLNRDSELYATAFKGKVVVVDKITKKKFMVSKDFAKSHLEYVMKGGKYLIAK